MRVLDRTSPGVAHQQLQQGIFLGGQIDRLACPSDGSRGRVESQVSHGQDGRPLPRPSTQQSAQAGQQLAEGERLGQIVIGAGIQPPDPVLDRVAGGEKENGSPPTGGPQLPAHLKAVQAGEHHIQDDRVIIVLGSKPQTLGPVARYVDGVALVLQPALQQCRHPRLVFDQQNPHPVVTPEAPLRRSQSAEPIPLQQISCCLVQGPATSLRPGDGNPTQRVSKQLM